MKKSTIVACVFAIGSSCGIGALAAPTSTSGFVDKLNRGDAQTLVVYGTSLTASGQWRRQLAAVLAARYGEKAVVKSGASNGKDSNWGLEHIATRVFPHKPDALFIEFGMNDAIEKRGTSVARARENLEAMIDKTQAAFPTCEIILMSMNPDRKHLLLNRPSGGRPHLAAYYAMYAEVARERTLLHIDLYRAWNAFLGEDLAKTRQHIPDGVHPNGLGARAVITPAILQAVGIDFSPDEIPLFDDPPAKKHNRRDIPRQENVDTVVEEKMPTQEGAQPYARMRSTIQKRRDEFFAEHSGKPLVRGKIRENWNGRGDFTRHYGQSIVMFAMRACVLNQQLDEANAAVRELCEYHLERPKTLFEVHSFPSAGRGLARLYYLYGPRGSKAADRLTEETCALLEKTMWEWSDEKAKFEEADVKESKTWWIRHSENHHANHFTTCWLFSGILRNSPVYRDRKFKDGRTPTEHYQAWTVYVKEYLRQRARKGMFIEIDSPSYASTVINTMYDCYDFSDDPVLKRRAGQLLELYWAQWAEQQIDAVTGGAKTRCYPEKVFSSCGFLPSAACYAVGSREAKLYHLSMVPPVTTSWRVPGVVLEIAASRGRYGPYEVLQRRPGLALKGYHRPSNYRLRTDFGGILRYTYCTPDFIMGSLITEARPDSDWAAISSQNRWAGVIFKGHPDARAFAVPYDDKANKAINGFWSLQCKGTTITQKLTPRPKSWRVFFSNAGLSEPVKHGSWFFAEAESAYVGVRIVNGESAWEAHEAGRWLVCSDTETPVIIEAARKVDHKSFTAFQDTLTARRLSFEGSVLTYQSLGGATLTFYADKSRIGEINGTPVNLAPQDVHDSPFVKSKWDSGVVTIQCGEERRMLNFNE